MTLIRAWEGKPLRTVSIGMGTAAVDFAVGFNSKYSVGKWEFIAKEQDRGQGKEITKSRYQG